MRHKSNAQLKKGRPTFREWFAQNEDRLLEAYAFDVFELSKERDPDKLKQISGFSEFARGAFAMAKENGELSKAKTKGATWNNTKPSHS